MSGNISEHFWFVFVISAIVCATSLHGATIPLSKDDERWNPCAPDDHLCIQIYSVKQDALGLLGIISDKFPDVFDDNVEETPAQEGGAVQKLTPPTEDTNDIVVTDSEEPSRVSTTEDDLPENSITTVLPELDTNWITLAEYEEVTTVVYDAVGSDVEGSASPSRGPDDKSLRAPVTERAGIAEEELPTTSPGEIHGDGEGDALTTTIVEEEHRVTSFEETAEDGEGGVVTTRIVEEEVVTDYVTEKAEEREGTTAGVDLTPAAPSTTQSAPTTEAVVTTAPTTLGTTREPPTTLPPLPRDCDEIWRRGNNESGVYHIYPEKSYRGFRVFCDLQDPVGGWTVILRRVDGSVNFYQSYFDYLMGFGDINREFYLGNEKIHLLTDQKKYELRIILFDFEGESRYAHYSLFRVGDYASDYQLTVRGYIGNAGNSLGYHSQGTFSTFDRDNDDNPAENCACTYASGWWFQKCDPRSNLNGLYLRGNHTEEGKGITWKKWKGLEYSLKYAEMKIRPIQL